MSILIPRTWLVMCIGAALTGCASSPAPVLLTLPSLDYATATPATTLGVPHVLAVRRPELPEYLLARRVRYRSDDSSLAEWPSAYWAERLEVSVAREFNHALRQRLPGWQLCEANCGERSPALSLQVKLTSMEYVRTDRMLNAHLRLSLWSVERAPRLLHTEDLTYVLSGDADTPQAQARAISAFLACAASDAARVVLGNP